jgi:polyisoprenoid-binding protein YceI
VNRIIFLILLLFSLDTNAQKYIGKSGRISFFSEAPIENIQATNNKVSAVYDANIKEIVFQLNIKDFIFSKKLMQEHFNENYLESDIYPTSTFQGKIVELLSHGNVRVQGALNIHGITNNISLEGFLLEKDGIVDIESNFSIRLEDYKIDIPKIVVYNIAEVIDIKVHIQLDEIR